MNINVNSEAFQERKIVIKWGFLVQKDLFEANFVFTLTKKGLTLR
jgi:hypothetical protein